MLSTTGVDAGVYVGTTVEEVEVNRLATSSLPLLTE